MKAGSQHYLWRQWFLGSGAAFAAALVVACGDSITGPAPVASVSVTIAAPTVAVGAKTQAFATVKDGGGNILDGRTITWTSSDIQVASVSSSGEVTALRTGTAEITATSEGKVGSAIVTVTPPPIHTITVTIANPALHVGETTQASAVAKDEAGNVLTGRPIVWTTSNSEVATVNEQGIVTAVKVGTASITATSEGKSGSASVAVGAAPIHSITVVIADPSMQVGSTRQASAIAKDASGNDLTGRPIVWSTDNAEVATVSPEGLVTGVKPGTATITATSEGKSGSATVTVSASASVSEVVVTLPQPGLSVGFSIQASATVKDASGNPIIGQPVTWSSSNTAVATVSQAGVVTGVGRGDAVITATSDGKTGSATIGVVVIRPQTLSVGNGHTCAIAVDGDAYCWGGNTGGQLGNGSTSPSNVPVRVAGGVKFTAISAGFIVTYALAENGQMYCWGRCLPEQTVLTPRPWATTRPAEVVDASDTGLATACLFRVGETAWCWGGNLHGELGRGIRGVAGVEYPEGPVAGNHPFADLATGNAQHVCAITTTGIGYCWGGGESGERGALGGGTGAAKESLVPQAIVGNHVFKDISVTELHTCAVTTAGEAWCWGDNNREQLGAPTGPCPWPGSLIDTCSAVPVAVTGGHVFEAISIGDRTSCGLRTDGEIYCWGLGYGLTPSPFGGGVKYRAVSSSVCALSTDGDVYCRSNGVVSKVPAPVKFRTP